MRLEMGISKMWTTTSSTSVGVVKEIKKLGCLSSDRTLKVAVIRQNSMGYLRSDKEHFVLQLMVQFKESLFK